MDEVELVLRVVVVLRAFVVRRIDDRVHAERLDAERPADLAEAVTVAELVEGSERVAHSAEHSFAVGKRELGEELAEVIPLLRAQRGAEELVDVGVVRAPRLLDLAEPLLGQYGVAHARVAVARLLRDKAAALEAVEQTCNPRRREQDLTSDVYAPHGVVRSVVELDENVEVAQRKAMLGLEPRRQLLCQSRVRAKEAHPCGHRGIRNFLRGQYLTRQSSLATIACAINYTRRFTSCPPLSLKHRPEPGQRIRSTRTSSSRSTTPARTSSAAASTTTRRPSRTASSPAPR